MATLSVTFEQAEAIVSKADEPECFMAYIANLNLPADHEAGDYIMEFWEKHLELEPDSLVESTISILVNNIPWEAVAGAAELRRELEDYLLWVDKDEIWTRQYLRNSWRKCENCGVAVMP
jgi:hypothetical protein